MTRSRAKTKSQKVFAVTQVEACKEVMKKPAAYEKCEVCGIICMNCECKPPPKKPAELSAADVYNERYGEPTNDILRAQKTNWLLGFNSRTSEVKGLVDALGAADSILNYENLACPAVDRALAKHRASLWRGDVKKMYVYYDYKLNEIYMRELDFYGCPTFNSIMLGGL